MDRAADDQLVDAHRGAEIVEDGTRVRPTFDPRQVGMKRVSSIQPLRFPVGDRVPVAVGIDLPAIGGETALTPSSVAP